MNQHRFLSMACDKAEYRNMLLEAITDFNNCETNEHKKAAIVELINALYLFSSDYYCKNERQS